MLNQFSTLEGGGNDGNFEKHLGRIARVGEDHHAAGGERIVRAWIVDDVLLGNIFIAERATGSLGCVSFPGSWDWVIAGLTEKLKKGWDRWL